jgi:hypothetical protein
MTDRKQSGESAGAVMDERPTIAAPLPSSSGTNGSARHADAQVAGGDARGAAGAAATSSSTDVVQVRPVEVVPTPGGVAATYDEDAELGQQVRREVEDDLPPLPERPVSTAAQKIGKVRKARLRLLRVEPWSVMKTAFVLSVALGITLVVAAAALWSVVDAAGVLDTVSSLLEELTSSNQSAGIQLTQYVSFDRVIGVATVIAVVDVIILTALATLFAFLYNLSASLLGGFEVTLAEDD